MLNINAASLTPTVIRSRRDVLQEVGAVPTGIRRRR